MIFKHFRFSVYTLLALTTIISISCGILYGLQDDTLRGGALLGASIVYPSILIGMLVDGPSAMRAFAAGALVPLFFLLTCLAVMIGMELFDALDFAAELPLDVLDLALTAGTEATSFIGVCWLFSLICGIVVYVVRCLVAHVNENGATSQ